MGWKRLAPCAFALVGACASQGCRGHSKASNSVPDSAAAAPLAFQIHAAGLLDGHSTTWEQARDVAFDDEGSMYVVGGASSPDFPVTAGAYDTSYASGGSDVGSLGSTNVFVVKLDRTGKLVWGTYLGGGNYDRAYAVEVDDKHDVYVAGRAGPGFPTTEGVVQRDFAGDSVRNGPYGAQDGFVSKLSADGSTLLWSTYFGESGPGFVRDMDIDAQGRVHLALSSVTGPDMDQKVTDNAAQRAKRGDFDTFYARLSADARSIEVGTYLGGNDGGGYYSANPSVRVLDDGTAYVLTSEPASGADTTRGVVQPAHAGGLDLLLAKYAPNGDLLFATYLGGSGDEYMDTHHLALTPAGQPVVTAASASDDYPLTGSTTGGGAIDVVVSMLSSDGTRLLHSVRVGGSGDDGPEGVATDAFGNVYVSGSTRSADLPCTATALDKDYGGDREGLLLVLSADLSTVRYLGYDGIPGEYANRACDVRPDGVWAVVGSTWHLSPFPATHGQDNRIDGEHAGFFQQLSRVD